MAEAVARALLAQAGFDDRIRVESFGTAGFHAGEGADPCAEAALHRAGWPVGAHRARRLEEAHLQASDLVLCADRDNLATVRRLANGMQNAAEIRLLRSYDPAVRTGQDEVPDPWGGTDADFDHCLSLIEKACRGLVSVLAAEL
jgi:protein-tyrosine phosphatase